MVLLEPHLPGREWSCGGRAKDNRQFINAVFCILRTGAPWKDLPSDYWSWCGIASRYDKNARSFLVVVQIRCIALLANSLWLQHLDI